MGRLHGNDSIETVASKPPPDFVEAAVRGTIGELELLASTPPDIVEPAVRERVGELEPLVSTPPDIVEAAVRGREVVDIRVSLLH